MQFFLEISRASGLFTLIADELGLCEIKFPGNRVAAKKKVLHQVDSLEHGVLYDAVNQLAQYLRGERTIFDLKISLHGTSFQQKVWKLLEEIPYGETRSYGDIARKLGGIGKARAVGGAANANPLPIVIPCHRLVGTDGRLTGFAGGLPLKKKLLELEGNTIHGDRIGAKGTQEDSR